jgi:ribonuclease HIII
LPKTITISFKELEKLKNYILSSGINRIPVKSEYELLRIRDADINIIVYKSGKCVYEDSPATREIIDRITFEKKEKYNYLLGSDETGKGEWYGPLVIACTALKPQQINQFRKIGIRDSKTLSKKKLFELENQARTIGFHKQITCLMPETYNRLYNQFKEEKKTLNDLLAWGHSAVIKTVLDLITFEKVKVVIDKFDVEKTYRRLYTLDESKIEIIQKSRGEREIPVALASILAKVRFENSVDLLDRKYGIDLRNSTPKDVPSNILPFVAKLHFKNVQKALEPN